MGHVNLVRVVLSLFETALLVISYFSQNRRNPQLHSQLQPINTLLPPLLFQFFSSSYIHLASICPSTSHPLPINLSSIFHQSFIPPWRLGLLFIIHGFMAIFSLQPSLLLRLCDASTPWSRLHHGHVALVMFTGMFLPSFAPSIICSFLPLLPSFPFLPFPSYVSPCCLCFPLCPFPTTPCVRLML